MSSTQRAFAQRNNNVTTLVPVLSRTSDLSTNTINITDASVYTLNLPSYYVGGIYVVDLSGNDSDGNPLDGAGIVDIVDGPDASANIIIFQINTSNIPSAFYPGAEFTIFFKNVPSNAVTGESYFGPLFTIGILANSATAESEVAPYIYSPLLPFRSTDDLTQSITLKSTGDSFSVVSSGPAGWIGRGLFTFLLGAAGVGPGEP